MTCSCMGTGPSRAGVERAGGPQGPSAAPGRRTWSKTSSLDVTRALSSYGLGETRGVFNRINLTSPRPGAGFRSRPPSTRTCSQRPSMSPPRGCPGGQGRLEDILHKGSKEDVESSRHLSELGAPEVSLDAHVAGRLKQRTQ